MDVKDKLVTLEELGEAYDALNNKFQPKLTLHTENISLSNGVGYLNIPQDSIVVGAHTNTYPCAVGYYNSKWFVYPVDGSSGTVKPIARDNITVKYWTI